MKENRKYFIVEISQDLQGKMRAAKKTHGINWGHLLRATIQTQLNRVHEKAASS